MMPAKYKMEIGEIQFMDGTKKPQSTMLLTEDNYNLINSIANIEVDADGNKTYIVNALKFKIVPYFETNNA